MFPQVPRPSMQPPVPKSRSLGFKLLIVCVLILVMAVPALFLNNLVDERTTRQDEVRSEISTHVGGPQTFLGPTLAVPYTIPAVSPQASETHGVYVIFPQIGDTAVTTTTEERHRSLFRVPVFRADLTMTGKFDLTGVSANAPPHAVLNWDRAEVIVGVSDARGALADGTLTTQAGTSTLAPSHVMQSWTLSRENREALKLTLSGARVNVTKPDVNLTAIAKLRFSGAERIAVLAYGKSTHVTAQSDWASPGFDGDVLPVSRSVRDHGFTAEWILPFIARGVPAEGAASDFSSLADTALGTTFVEVADPYQSVSRSLKYVLLFLSLVFLTYFVFEATTKKRVHPAQYVMIGVAQLIFYLLLLSLSERLGFDPAFLLGGTATVALLSFNAGWIFGSHLQAVRAAVVFSLLYLFIYMLLKLEDNALLIGAIASFAAVSAVMYFTRNLNWYSSGPNAGAPPAQMPQSPPMRYESLLDPL